jgi:hypothetical protein
VQGQFAEPARRDDELLLSWNWVGTRIRVVAAAGRAVLAALARRVNHFGHNYAGFHQQGVKSAALAGFVKAVVTGEVIDESLEKLQ